MRTFSSLYLKKVLTSTVTWEFMSRERERERENYEPMKGQCGD